MELCEAHWCRQNAAAQGRTVKGQDRGAVGQHQERAPTCPVILPSTNCRLYYRLVSKSYWGLVPPRSSRMNCSSRSRATADFAFLRDTPVYRSIASADHAVVRLSLAVPRAST